MQISSFEKSEVVVDHVRGGLAEWCFVDTKEYRARFADIDRVLRYFEDKTKGKRLPRRSDVVPSELKDVLPDICFMAPVFDPAGVIEDITVQLMGTNVVSFYGEMTGKSVFEHPSSQIGQRILASMTKAIRDREPVTTFANSLSDEKSHLQVSVLYIPMAENGKDIDRFFMHVGVYRKIHD
ncbi:MAG: PAS domain-containing protein [Alphaproteobacteria bacterium]|nr:PAS domain-containing protein [Alphaproteobacteria bacterium]